MSSMLAKLVLAPTVGTALSRLTFPTTYWIPR
jgi:hypothetical protein